ncbi:FUSC family protein [Francisella sp. 19X1-34]|uniref:FUSC family protein n=1 Tax=Francisella sp. 19X1-34 TaxID=3087177 RepID=UPI002E344F71|nr:FUSC family protein [Francisella sp. 19X1-34]MED7787878.1 FUSC family protein [Francisella sp. 19X1-34]
MKIDDELFLAMERKKLWDSIIDEIKNFSFKGAQFKFAIRSSIALITTIILTWILQIPEGWWAAISAIVASQENIGLSYHRGLNRFLGTFFGGFLGLLCNIYFFENEFIYLLYALLLFFVIYYFREIDEDYRYSWDMAAATAALVLFGGMKVSLNPSSINIIGDFYTIFFYRSLEVGLGVSVGILCSKIIFPKLSESAAYNKTILVYKNFPDLVTLIFERYNKGENQLQFDKLHKKQSGMINELLSLLKRVRQEKKLKDHIYHYSLLEQFARELNLIIVHTYEHLHDNNEYYNFSELKLVIYNFFNLFSYHLRNDSLINNEDFQILRKALVQNKQRLLNINSPDSNLLSEIMTLIEKLIVKLETRKIDYHESNETAISHFSSLLFSRGISFIDTMYLKNALIYSAMTVIPTIVLAFWGLANYDQMAVTIVVCASLNKARFRTVSVQRLSGCFAGFIVTMLVLTLDVQNKYEMAVILFISMFIFQYLYGGNGNVTYFGRQTLMVISIGLIQGLSPLDSIIPALERLDGIFMGVLVVIIIELFIKIEVTEQIIVQNIKNANKAISESLEIVYNTSDLYHPKNVYSFSNIRNVVFSLRKVQGTNKLLNSLNKNMILYVKNTYRAIFMFLLFHELNDKIISSADRKLLLYLVKIIKLNDKNLVIINKKIRLLSKIIQKRHDSNQSRGIYQPYESQLCIMIIENLLNYYRTFSKIQNLSIDSSYKYQ